MDDYFGMEGTRKMKRRGKERKQNLFCTFVTWNENQIYRQNEV